MLLRPLPYRDPVRLVVALHEGTFPVSPADYFDYRAQNRSFSSIGAAQAWSANLSGDGTPERIGGIAVSPEIFPLLGVEPLHGRVFTAGDDQPGRNHRIVLSHGLWQRRFGAEPNLIGHAITLDGAAWEVAAVMPPSFRFAPFWITDAEAWVPLDLSARLGDRGGRSLRVFARLKAGVSIDQARADISAIAAEISRRNPEESPRGDMRVASLGATVTGPVRPGLLVLLSTVGLLLLIACANTAALILARTASRAREIGVRLALGAGRADLLRQLVAESVWLSVAGGVAGLLFARWGVSALVATLPSRGLPGAEEISIDGGVLWFTLAASLCAGVLAGLAPAWRAARVSLTDALRAGGRTASGTLRQARLRGWLTGAEVALALVLLAGAGLLVKSFARLRSVAPGFEPAYLLSLTVSTGGTVRDAPARRAAFYEHVLERLHRIPGVEAAGAINHAPLSGDIWSLGVQIDGRPLPPSELPSAVYRIATPGYFRALRVPLLRGRDFSPTDTADSVRVAIVNETLARRFWPGKEAIGMRLALGRAQPPQWRTIVGVVRDLKQGDFTAASNPELFLPLAQQAGEARSYFTFVIRTRADPASFVAAVRRQMAAYEPRAVVSRALPMERAIADQLWRARVSAFLLSVFAVVALVLAAAGVYGVIAHSVAERTREIGIRMALGARPVEVLRLVVLGGMRCVWAGLAAGLLLAAAGSRYLEKLLYQVAPSDPWMHAGAALSLAAVALLANLAPAAKALRIDPTTALRAE